MSGSGFSWEVGRAMLWSVWEVAGEDGWHWGATGAHGIRNGVEATRGEADYAAREAVKALGVRA